MLNKFLRSSKVIDVNHVNESEGYEDDLNHIKARPWSYIISAFLVIFTTSIAVGFMIPALSKKPLLYFQNCSSGSCSAKFNLECLNGICQCNINSFFAKGCKTKKNYLEKCHNSSAQCNDNNLNLVCLDGVCKCDDFNYWNGKKCLPRQLYGSYCDKNIQCLTLGLLYCDMNIMQCKCQNGRLVTN